MYFVERDNPKSLKKLDRDELILLRKEQCK